MRDPGGYLWGFGTYDMAAGTGESRIFPGVHYRDARSAIRFLIDAFGFEKTLEVPGPDDTVMHAELRFGGGVLMTGELRVPPDAGDARQLVCVHVDNPDEHHKRAMAGGATIVMEPQTTPYGARHFAARDPKACCGCSAPISRRRDAQLLTVPRCVTRSKTDLCFCVFCGWSFCGICGLP